MREEVFQPLKRQRLHEMIADRLEEMILAGEFKPGEALPTEVEMASQFDVSRAAVRDAIRVLAAKGLVDIRHGVGTFVTHSGRERLAEALELSLRRGDYTPWELYVIRRGLEMIVVEEAVAKATDEQIAQMRRVLQEYRELLLSDAGDEQQSVDRHVLFHQLMTRSTGNRVLMDFLDPITVFRIPYSWGLASPPTPDREAYESYIRGHEKIVDAIERRDVEAAKAAMLEHLADLAERARRATEEMQRSQGA